MNKYSNCIVIKRKKPTLLQMKQRPTLWYWDSGDCGGLRILLPDDRSIRFNKRSWEPSYLGIDDFKYDKEFEFLGFL